MGIIKIIKKNLGPAGNSNTFLNLFTAEMNGYSTVFKAIFDPIVSAA
jgi:hypothetical protein